MKDTLVKYDFEDIIVTDTDKHKQYIRDFINANAGIVKRLYKADYSHSKLKSMLSMLGFYVRPCPGSNKPAKYKVKSLVCYQSNSSKLVDILQHISEE